MKQSISVPFLTISGLRRITFIEIGGDGGCSHGKTFQGGTRNDLPIRAFSGSAGGQTAGGGSTTRGVR